MTYASYESTADEAQTPEQGDEAERPPEEGGGFQAVAGEFGRNVEEAAGKLGGAAQQFVAMTASFLAAGDRLEQALAAHRRMETESHQAAESAQSAATEARSAAERSEESRRAAEDTLAKIASQYGEMSSLVADLQERIAALAVLARPIRTDPPREDERERAGEGLLVVQGRPRMLHAGAETPLAANE